MPGLQSISAGSAVILWKTANSFRSGGFLLQKLPEPDLENGRLAIITRIDIIPAYRICSQDEIKQMVTLFLSHICF